MEYRRGDVRDPDAVLALVEAVGHDLRDLSSADEAEFRFVRGRPNDVIRQTMHDTGADLLVMGAQGHGFIDRVLIGSYDEHLYALGAKNCELHFAQVRGAWTAPAGVVMPTFMPETG